MPVWLVDLILAGVALEASGLALWLRRRGQRRLIRPVLLFLASGTAMLIAVRLALTGAGLAPIGAVLALSGVTHIACLRAGFALTKSGNAGGPSGQRGKSARQK